MHVYCEKIAIFYLFSECPVLVGVVCDTFIGLKHVECYLTIERWKTSAVKCFSKIKKKRNPLIDFNRHVKKSVGVSDEPDIVYVPYDNQISSGTRDPI